MNSSELYHYANGYFDARRHEIEAMGLTEREQRRLFEMLGNFFIGASMTLEEFLASMEDD